MNYPETKYTDHLRKQYQPGYINHLRKQFVQEKHPKGKILSQYRVDLDLENELAEAYKQRMIRSIGALVTLIFVLWMIFFDFRKMMIQSITTSPYLLLFPLGATIIAIPLLIAFPIIVDSNKERVILSVNYVVEISILLITLATLFSLFWF